MNYKKKDGTVSTYNYTKENPIDKMCDLVNQKYGLRNRQIGSIERYTDSCTNEIVQIGNKYGGHTTLISGTEKVLKNFLQKILDDKVFLNIGGV